jgi:hypothetical protein
VLESPPGAQASWMVEAPAGTSIVRAQLSRHLGNRGSWRASIVSGDGSILENCPIVFGLHCELGSRAGIGSENTTTFLGLRTPRIELRLQCASASTCANNPTVEQAWIAVYSAKVSVEDPAAPVVAPVTGTYGAGWQRGTATVGVSATDASGIRTLRVSAASRELASLAPACDFTRMQPCPGSVSETFSFDTAQLPDGTHELKVVATDAADQAAEAVGKIRVDRNAPGAPTSVKIAPGPDGAFVLTWTAPEQGTASPIVAAHAAVCEVTCQPAQRVLAPGGNVDLPAARSSLRVWLEDEAGNADPAKAATVSVDTAALRSTRVVDTNPPVLLPSGPLPSSRIKLTRARRSGSTLTLSGTIVRGASARISARVTRTRAGRLIASGRGTPRNGRWAVRLKLPAAARRAGSLYLTLNYAGEADFRQATLRRKLSRSRTPRGDTAVEFSIETPR